MPWPALTGKHGRRWQAVDEGRQFALVERLGITIRIVLEGLLARGQERKCSRHIAAKSLKQAEWIVRRHAEGARYRRPLAVFRQKASEDSLAYTIIEGFAALGQGFLFGFHCSGCLPRQNFETLTVMLCDHFVPGISRRPA